MAYSFAAHLARYGPDADYPVPDLAAARSYCARLTRSHYENFTVASAFLPRRLLPHFYPIYAYCRWADDLGDETGGGERAVRLLDWWRQQLLDCYQGKAKHPVMVALRPTIERFAIPPEPFLDLLIAFSQDQHNQRYATFDDLLHYCKHSANPVGRLVLYLCESFNDKTAVLSDEVCTGLQLANHWQDVRRDFLELGRVYLPEHDRQKFGYGDDDLAVCRLTPQFRELMRFEVARAREFFERGRPLLELVPANVRVDIELFIEGGMAILRKIEAVDFDVLTMRPKLSKGEKVRLLVGAVKNKAWSLLERTPLRSGRGRNSLAPLPVSGRGRGRGSFFRWASKTRTTLQTLERGSYTYCHHLTRKTARNFYFAFQVLPRDQRRAMEALYAFMRVTDDLADEPGESEAKRKALKNWREQLDRALSGAHSHPLHPALSDVVHRFGIPPRYLHVVIDGVMMDLEPVTIATFDELYAYCYRVASAVGLACIHIWGFRDEKAKEYAEAAGIAFQLTNILRDLGEDWSNGRVYLPREELVRFDSLPESWQQGKSEKFQRMMCFQVERARDYYRKAEPLAKYLSPSGRAVLQVMTGIYRGLLEEIERREYDVFTERVRLSRWRKLRTLLLAFPVRWGWL